MHIQLWVVWDSQTDQPITWKDGQEKRFETYKSANRVAERWNQAYGAVRYAPVLKSIESKDIKSLNSETNPAPAVPLDKF